MLLNTLKFITIMYKLSIHLVYLIAYDTRKITILRKYDFLFFVLS